MSKSEAPLPQFTFRFQVSFWKDGEKLPFSDQLAFQIASVSGFNQNGNLLETYNSFSMIFQDDQLNRSSEGLQELLKLDSFTTKIEYLDGSGDAIRTASLFNCNVADLSHSGLDYSASPSSKATILSLRFPDLLGKKIDELRVNSPELDAIFTLVGGATFELHGKQETDNSIVTTEASISYDSINWDFSTK